MGERITLSAWIYAAMAVLAIFGALADAAFVIPITAVLIILYIAIEVRRIPRAQQIAGFVLLLIGTAGALIGGEGQAVIADGIARSRTFLVLFFAVAWLQPPVSLSPALRATRETIVTQPPGRRYLYLASGVHVLGAVLNIAGFSLLTTIVDKDTPMDGTLRRRLSLALMQGFTAASCWSPFYIGTIVVLVAVPSLTWVEIAPYGVAMATILIAGNWVRDRIGRGKTSRQATARETVPLSRAHAIRAAGILITLIILVTTLVETLHASIPVVLGLLAPPFGLIWYWTIARARSTAPRTVTVGAVPELAHRVIAALPTLRNESLVFVAANVLGVGVASAVPTENLGDAFTTLIPWADARIIAIILIFLACGSIGLHPVIVVVSLSAILPPEALGLPDLIVGLTYMGCWGMSTMISPFSGTTLFMSRVTGVPGHIISWRWAPMVALTSAGLVAICVISARHLLA